MDASGNGTVSLVSPNETADCVVRIISASDAPISSVRIDHTTRQSLDIHSGDFVEIKLGSQTLVRQALPLSGCQGTDDERTGLIALALDGRDFHEIAEDKPATLRKLEAIPATAISVLLRRGKGRSVLGIAKLIRQTLRNCPIAQGDNIRIPLTNTRVIEGEVLTVTSPRGGPAHVIISTDETRVDLIDKENRESLEAIGYDGVGALAQQKVRVREIIDTPIKSPEVFQHLGIEAPKGVLLVGPPGTGKTLLARAIAEESGAAFFQINGPEIASKHFGESEKLLREIFSNAAKKSPSVIFIDELDAIAPKREMLAGDRQVERRVVAQLLTLMDGLSRRGRVVVMAATNLPDSIDDALRRPGRFDREVAFDPPDEVGRREILDVHTRRMPLGETVDLDDLAQLTHGFVGADLAALAREAAMTALRRHGTSTPNANIVVEGEDFLSAQKEIIPSALRTFYFETPDVTWSDVIGHQGVKDALTQAVIWPLRYGRLLAQVGVAPHRGILLAGPPGAGKTLIAKALANEAGINFIAVQGPQLLTQHFGETERAIRSLFAKARMASPCIVFLDEIDAIAPRRGGEASMDRIVGQLLTELDGLTMRPGVFVLGATNRPDAIDQALIRAGRFDLTLTLKSPSEDERRQMISRSIDHQIFSDDASLRRVAKQMDGMMGAEIAAVCRLAGMSACNRMIKRIEQKRSDDLASINVDHFEIYESDFTDAVTVMRDTHSAKQSSFT
ncbi:MAG: AAA family ATPase [Pseudomonadota bacterium]